MKRFCFYSSMAILLLAAVLSGCGGGSNNGNPSTTSNPPTTNPPTAFSIAESLVPGATGLSFPTGTNDSGVCTTVTYPYYMAQKEVTYQLWSTVKTWATANGYIFAHSGSCGGYIDAITYTGGTYTSGRETDPITEISWRDAVVWCNALTEYYNAQNGTSLNCAYTSGGTPIRDSKNSTATIDGLTDDGHTAKGFRLPTGNEWELAARYRGNDSINTVSGYSNPYFTKGNSASGATAAYTDTDASQAVSWYNANSGYSTHPVGQKTANALGIYDMSGNISEFCFDLYSAGGWSARYIRGHCWTDSPISLEIGIGSNNNMMDFYDCNYTVGFRPVRTQ
jgi:sulfatase modifying factor 1